MRTVLKGVFSKDNQIFQMWAEPPTPMLPEYIRNDYDESINEQSTVTLAIGDMTTMSRIHCMWVTIMNEQAEKAKCSATQVPTSIFDI